MKAWQTTRTPCCRTENWSTLTLPLTQLQQLQVSCNLPWKQQCIRRIHSRCYPWRQAWAMGPKGKQINFKNFCPVEGSQQQFPLSQKQVLSLSSFSPDLESRGFRASLIDWFWLPFILFLLVDMFNTTVACTNLPFRQGLACFHTKDLCTNHKY